MRLVALIVDCVIVSAGSYLVAVELASSVVEHWQLKPGAPEFLVTSVVAVRDSCTHATTPLHSCQCHTR